MAGHSKWAGIKHKKAIVDAQRGKTFSKINRELTVAARMGGRDPAANPRLRLAIGKAREANMPKDTIEKAVQRGTGDLPGVSYEEIVMEAYGQGGVAILIEGLTDNKNRTSAELRSILHKHGGNPAGAGSVSWLFQKRGLITLSDLSAGEDRLLELALEAGAEDFKVDGAQALITTPPGALEAVKQAFESQRIPFDTAELAMVPSTSVRVEDPAAAKGLLGLLELLEEHDDVQAVHANFDIPDALLGEAAGG
ncbi:MAG TPA: YebC/PmpR family DNA-binding transcriptional regulator [bacterium]